MSLASRLRAETQSLHTQVERSAFMATLLSGRLDHHGYCLLLRNLHPIYLSLEAGMARPRVRLALAPLLSDELPRAPALARDLDALQGPSWPTDLPVLPPAQAYAEHLETLEHTRPMLLSAHAYVRYLGDLSGGQMLKRIVTRSLQLPESSASDVAGIAFYEFGPPDTVKALAAAIRTGLDAIAGDDATADAIVDEAQRAFEMHGHLFDALARACGLPRPAPLNAPR